MIKLGITKGIRRIVDYLLKNEVRDVKNEVRDVKNEVRDVKNEVRDVKNEIHEVKSGFAEIDLLAHQLKRIKHKDGENPFYVYKDQILFTCSNYGVLIEVFVEESYFINDNKPYIVMDMGANIGYATLYFAQNLYIEKVYSYEPAKILFDEFAKNVNYNSILKQKIELHHFALGKEEADAEIYIPKDSGARSGSTLSTVGSPGRNQQKKGSTIVEKIKIKEASKELIRIINNHPNNPLLVKMDIEGSEYAVLENLRENNLLEKIDLMFVEFHSGLESIPKYLSEYFDCEIVQNREVPHLIFVTCHKKQQHA